MKDIKSIEKRYRANDIVNIFGISRSTVDNWVKYGYLTRIPIGRNIFYSAKEVEQLQKYGA